MIGFSCARISRRTRWQPRVDGTCTLWTWRPGWACQRSTGGRAAHPPRPTAATSPSTSLSTWAKYQVHVPVSCLLNLGWDCHQCELQIYSKIQHMKILFAYVGWDCHQCELQIYSKILHMKILFAYVVALYSCTCFCEMLRITVKEKCIVIWRCLKALLKYLHCAFAFLAWSCPLNFVLCFFFLKC
jgi:hypothetical protein